ncbi:ABC transporter ATP-binding protein, partial [Vibrio cholerae]
LHSSPIFLLDEFTSALDSQTQAQVLQAIKTFSQGKTVISVAHRLETIEQADKIYEMEAGQLRRVGENQYLARIQQGNQHDYKHSQIA